MTSRVSNESAAGERQDPRGVPNEPAPTSDWTQGLRQVEHEIRTVALAEWNLAGSRADALRRWASECGEAVSRREWHPAVSAPRDGSAFRAYDQSFVDPDFNPLGSVEACFDGERYVGAVWDGQFDCWNTVAISFTYWMPLPASPVAPSGPKP